MKKNLFSTINTKTKILRQSGKIFFDKEFCINVAEMRNKKYLKKILKLTKTYFYEIRKSGLNIPHLYYLKIYRNKILCRMEYKGKNLLQKGLNSKNLKKFSSNIDDILMLILKAKNIKLMIDPHIKNFVFDGKGKTFYVDIFPPYSNKFQNIRKSFYKNHEINILTKNFQCFYPKKLFYHFVSDILRNDPRQIKNINFFYKKLRKKNLIFSRKKFFLRKVLEIKKIEASRIKKKLYLS